tara:strand:- start:347 stop:469 length:123 start_codon:yes stop_codon:yes gene_type:complete
MTTGKMFGELEIVSAKVSKKNGEQKQGISEQPQREKDIRY